jgi:hypothetical protein
MGGRLWLMKALSWARLAEARQPHRQLGQRSSLWSEDQGRNTVQSRSDA